MENKRKGLRRLSNYYIGADLGTSGLKLLLVDAKNKLNIYSQRQDDEK